MKPAAERHRRQFHYDAKLSGDGFRRWRLLDALGRLAFYVLMAGLWRLHLLSQIEPILIGWMGLEWFWTFAPQAFGFEPSWLLGALLIQDYIPFFAIGIAAYRLRAPGSSALAAPVIAAALVTVTACEDLSHLAVALVSAAACC
jgi:hypothetical protein